MNVNSVREIIEYIATIEGGTAECVVQKSIGTFTYSYVNRKAQGPLVFLVIVMAPARVCIINGYLPVITIIGDPIHTF